jgi:hypothetical protein
MSHRHFELPANPNLEYYRKQAKQLLHLYATGVAAAADRAADVLGDCATERFLLSDAQFVLAQEHGFRTWAEFRADIERRNTTEDQPVSRILGLSASVYAGQVKVLLADLRRNDPIALVRLRTYVPRQAGAGIQPSNAGTRNWSSRASSVFLPGGSCSPIRRSPGATSTSATRSGDSSSRRSRLWWPVTSVGSRASPPSRPTTCSTCSRCLGKSRAEHWRGSSECRGPG